MSDETTKREETPTQTGNAAKLREALEGCRDYLYDRLRDAFYDAQVASQSDNPRIEGLEMEQQLHREVEAALAAPPRNCDVGTAEEQNARMSDWCHRTHCGDCPSKLCALSWANAPYEAAQEGGDHADA